MSEWLNRIEHPWPYQDSSPYPPEATAGRRSLMVKKKLIGYSLSRCLVDVAEGRVTLDQIERIEARTCFDPENQRHWETVWRGYTQPNYWAIHRWAGYLEREEEFRAWTLALHRSGRLTQARRDGGNPLSRDEHWETVVE